jgi:CheY-like chemotaxis protein
MNIFQKINATVSSWFSDHDTISENISIKIGSSRGPHKMAKLMLVEDDNNLREIYEARLRAEGYEIVSAKDGEEALAMAVKERPDLIIADVMMPKISGFDMLDILRSTPETKDTKVIMMTALSQAEDKARAEKLGADRYLVKSQVTLEDVAKVTREVLAGMPAAPPAGSSAANAASEGSTPAALQTPAPTTSEPATPTPAAPSPNPPAPVTANIPVAEPPAVSSPNEQVLASAVADMSGAASTAVPPVATPPASGSPFTPQARPMADDNIQDNKDDIKNDVAVKTGLHTKVIEPVNDLGASKPDLNALLAKEEAAERAAAAGGSIAPQDANNQKSSDSDSIAL